MIAQHAVLVERGCVVPSNQQPPRFCGQCGAALPPGMPQFCIECGHRVGISAEHVPDVVQPHPISGPTVRLPNARSEQSVIGGTMKLPTAGALPPGLWLRPEMPGADDVIAVYAPLRAVVGGWSGTTSDGWRKVDQSWAHDGSSRELVRFDVQREWFAALGCAEGARLRVRLSATSYAAEGRTRRGFRYHIGADPPMELADARWFDADGRPCPGVPIPQVQIMAPPRVLRVSDYSEAIQHMSMREAVQWARVGSVHMPLRMPDSTQQRTPVGRGISLFEVPGGSMLRSLAGLVFQLSYVQVRHPLVVDAGTWGPLQQRIQGEARGLGLDMPTDAVIEWWLDRQGYDGAWFKSNAHPFALGGAVVVFRRSQIVQATG